MKFAVLSTTVLLGLGNVIAIPAVKADSITNIQSKRIGIQAGISQADSSIAQTQAALAKLTEQINRAEQAIHDNNQMIIDTEKKMADTNIEINQLQEQIAIIKDRIEKRNVILKKRALSFQETGGNVSYLDVLLGASSFSDLVDRVGAVTSLVEADQDLLKQHQADKQAVEEKQASVQKKLDDLTAMKTDLEGMQAQLADQQAQNEAMKQQLTQQATDSLAQKAALLQQDQQLALAAAALEQGAQESQKQTVANPSSSKGNQSSSSTPSKTSNGSISDVIHAGYKYIGNSVYVFGGGRTQSDIANGRFDCSGFVHWAFAQAGISVGVSTDSLTGAGRQIPANQMQPGDLVFFDTYKTNGHVGIYIGGGNFIGSQSTTGVAVANMSSGYWQQHFNGRVVRVL